MGEAGAHHRDGIRVRVDEQEAAAEEADEALRREKSKNVMYRASEKTGGEKPIDLIKATRPIIIVDEPQSVDGGLQGRGKQALDAMNPLCTLRYSATHVNKHHMVYRLDAVDAYDRKLVKQIEVAAATVQGGNNRPYVKLLAVSNKRGVISASVEVDRENSAGVVRRDTITVQDGFDFWVGDGELDDAAHALLRATAASCALRTSLDTSGEPSANSSAAQTTTLGKRFANAGQELLVAFEEGAFAGMAQHGVDRVHVQLLPRP